MIHARSLPYSRVVAQPSSKTNFVVLGSNAGQSKLNAIAKHQLKTLSEDEFLELIATREGPSAGGEEDEKAKKKREKEMKVIRESAKEMERREKVVEKGKGTGCVFLFLFYFTMLSGADVMRFLVL